MSTVSFSRTLRTLQNVLTWVVVLALTIWFSNHLRWFGAEDAAWVGILFAFLVSTIAVLASLRLFRPLIRSACLSGFRLLVRSGVKGLVDLGVLGLLTYSSPEHAVQQVDYTGLEALHQTFDALDKSGQEQVLQTVQHFEQSPGCPFAREAVMFLEAVER